MVLSAIFVAALVALAVAVVILWGAFEALVRISRFLWRLLTEQ